MSSRLLGPSWLPLVVTVLTAVPVLVGNDVPLADVGIYTTYVAFGIAVPGVFTWRLMLRRLHVDEDGCPTWFEDLSLGTIMGFGVQLPFFLLGVAIGVPFLVLLFPALVLVLSATPLGRGVWSLPTARLDPRVSWGLAAVSVYGLVWLRSNIFPLRPLSLPPNRVPGLDETFHQALVSDIANRFPPQIPYLLDTRLDYHWFVHGQIATSESITGINSVVMLRLVLPVVLLFLIVAGLGAVALRLSGRPVAAFLAPALLVAGAFHLLGPAYPSGSFIEPLMSVRFATSPSQTYGVMMSMPALMLILEVLRAERRPPRGVWVALAITLLGLAGSKATFLPIFLCGAIGVWAVLLLLRRRVDRAATGLVVLVVLATAFAQFVIFGGKTGSMTLDPFHTVTTAVRTQNLTVTPVARAAMLGTLLTGWLLYGIGMVGLLPRRGWLDPRAVFMLVCVPAGTTVALMFFRSGLSQLWFQRSVAELVVLLSAWGMSRLLPQPLTPRCAVRLVVLAAAAGLCAYTVSWMVSEQNAGNRATATGLVLTALTPLAVGAVYMVVRRLSAGTPDRRWRPGPVVVLTVLLGLGSSNVVNLAREELTGVRHSHHETAELFAKGGVAAAEYVKDNSSVDDIVATNMHCKEPHARRCDNRHFWLSAYSERRVVIEGWGYSAPTNALATAGSRNAYIRVPFPDRLETNDAAFREPSEQTVGTLVDTYDVKWLVVGKPYSADVKRLRALDDLLTPAFENNHYIVFEVR